MYDSEVINGEAQTEEVSCEQERRKQKNTVFWYFNVFSPSRKKKNTYMQYKLPRR